MTAATSTTGRLRTPAGTARLLASRAEAAVDGALVRRFKEGDNAAFAEIVARHRGKTHALALRFMRNHADAEEVAQDTFIRAHRGLAQFRGDASLSTWLHHITFNLARNRQWYFFRRRRHLTSSLDCPIGADTTTTFADRVAAPEAGPVRRAMMDELVALVGTSLQKLDPEQREILTLRVLLHRSYQEIAGLLGTNSGTVKSRIARARGKLRDCIGETCPEFPADAAVADWLEPAVGTSHAG